MSSTLSKYHQTSSIQKHSKQLTSGQPFPLTPSQILNPLTLSKRSSRNILFLWCNTKNHRSVPQRRITPQNLWSILRLLPNSLLELFIAARKLFAKKAILGTQVCTEFTAFEFPPFFCLDHSLHTLHDRWYSAMAKNTNFAFLVGDCYHLFTLQTSRYVLHVIHYVIVCNKFFFLLYNSSNYFALYVGSGHILSVFEIILAFFYCQINAFPVNYYFSLHFQTFFGTSNTSIFYCATKHYK